MRTFTKGSDPNHLKLAVNSLEVLPHSHGSNIGILITVTQYNLEDLLCQLLEDYGDEELIKRIKQLNFILNYEAIKRLY